MKPEVREHFDWVVARRQGRGDLDRDVEIPDERVDGEVTLCFHMLTPAERRQVYIDRTHVLWLTGITGPDRSGGLIVARRKT